MSSVGRWRRDLDSLMRLLKFVIIHFKALWTFFASGLNGPFGFPIWTRYDLRWPTPAALFSLTWPHLTSKYFCSIEYWGLRGILILIIIFRLNQLIPNSNGESKVIFIARYVNSGCIYLFIYLFYSFLFNLIPYMIMYNWIYICILI